MPKMNNMANTMTQTLEKRVKSVRVTNKKAVALINDKAARDFRSASSTAALVIIEALSGGDNTNKPDDNQEKSGGDNGEE